MEDITEAQSFENAAEQAFSEADYSVYTKYLAARKDAIQVLMDSDNAIASGDFDSAQASIEDYNKREAASSELAQQLPETPDTFLSEAYEAALKKPLDTYKEIAEALAATDKKIRDYQGLAVGSSKKA